MIATAVRRPILRMLRRSKGAWSIPVVSMFEPAADSDDGKGDMACCDVADETVDHFTDLSLR